ncbi:MAG: hypothetical protein UV60_C0002G0061 [Parcubacteria group bacterium GW2011_GWA2_43_11]|nr:MAG: hypothetical protein UV60_C0002G0061 [Parcubacteria group bacterium GW2011_GWA2_43_11]
MTNFDLLYQPFKQQGGRCFVCAQPFRFKISGFHNLTNACHCPSCQEEELEEMVLLLNTEVEEGAFLH